MHRVQDEVLARLWAAQQKECTRDPVETGSQASCSTCGKLGSGRRREGAEVPGVWGRAIVWCHRHVVQ